jgi:blocked-early-in-transport protein 1
MSNRFGRDAARDDLFSSYNRSSSPSKDKKKARASPYNNSNGGYGLPGASSPGFGAYPGSSSGNGGLYGGYGQGGSGASDGGYRSATPNGRGQYGSATLDELESQNEEQTGVLIGKVKMLKDVRFPPPFPLPYLLPRNELFPLLSAPSSPMDPVCLKLT